MLVRGTARSPGLLAPGFRQRSAAADIRATFSLPATIYEPLAAWHTGSNVSFYLLRFQSSLQKRARRVDRPERQRSTQEGSLSS